MRSNLFFPQGEVHIVSWEMFMPDLVNYSAKSGQIQCQCIIPFSPTSKHNIPHPSVQFYPGKSTLLSLTGFTPKTKQNDHVSTVKLAEDTTRPT